VCADNLLTQAADFDCPRATRLKPLRRTVPLSDEVGQWKSTAWGNSTSAVTEVVKMELLVAYAVAAAWDFGRQFAKIAFERFLP
jgi:hypothetical protein